MVWHMQRDTGHEEDIFIYIYRAFITAEKNIYVSVARKKEFEHHQSNPLVHFLLV